MEMDLSQKIIVAAIVAVIVLFMFLFIINMITSTENSSYANIKDQNLPQDYINSLGRTLIMTQYPTSSIICRKDVGEENNYRLAINSMKVKFETGDDSMEVVPVLAFKDQKTKFAGNPIPINKGEETALSLIFDVKSTDPPAVYMGRNQPSYEGKIYPQQSVYVGAYKFQLRDFSKILTSFSNIGVCKAEISIECRDQYDYTTLYLEDMTKTCEEQKDPSKCTINIPEFCKNPATIRLERIEGTSSIPRFTSCGNFDPVFFIDVQDDQGKLVSQLNSDEASNQNMLGEPYIIAFWKSEQGKEDCYSRSLIYLGDCKDNFLGAYQLRVPVKEGSYWPLFPDPRELC
jgi:hypothetical protein